jgi:hypothetical protein
MDAASRAILENQIAIMGYLSSNRIGPSDLAVMIRSTDRLLKEDDGGLEKRMEIERSREGIEA